MKTIAIKKIRTVLGIILSILIFASGNVKAHESAGNSQIHSVNLNYKLYQICKNDLEGYSEQIDGGMYTYPSLRDDVRQSMIARASTGKVGFTFYTSTVPADFKEEMVSFFFSM